MLGAGVALMVTGMAWAMSSSETVDRDFDPRVGEAAVRGRWRAQVVIDEAHYNGHTASGTYRPFADLLRRDGYRVRRNSDALSSAVLEGNRVVVIANALGFRGVLRQALAFERLGRVLPFRASAISGAEIAEVEVWVRGGGALLLVADHAPAGEAVRRLAAAFGVDMTDRWTEDAVHHDPVTGNRAFILFSRADGLLPDHPITNGRDPAEQIHRVMTFTGQALRPPDRAVSLLTLSATAREYPDRPSREGEGRSAAGLAQAVALEHGLGRVVVVGSAAALTAQTTRRPDGSRLLFGMNRDDTDNRQFVLNILHWLSGVL